MMKQRFGKRGSEVIQNLIVIAVMGAVAITTLAAIATKLKTKNTAILDDIDQGLSDAQRDASEDDGD